MGRSEIEKQTSTNQHTGRSANLEAPGIAKIKNVLIAWSYRSQPPMHGAAHAAVPFPVAEQKVPAGQSLLKLQEFPKWLDAQTLFS